MDWGAFVIGVIAGFLLATCLYIWYLVRYPADHSRCSSSYRSHHW